MKLGSRGCWLALLPWIAAAAGQRPALAPFVIDPWAANESSLDLGLPADGPAGSAGLIRIADGHLVKPTGERFRIWGVNLTAFAKDSIRFPAKADADFWAGTLARYGVNCVRLHNLDIPAPRGIIAAGNDTRSLDPRQLDLMDYFVAALKRHGIYVDLNLNVGRSYRAGDGVRDFELIGYAKALTYFDPRLIELQQEYARKLLTHFNPYTKAEYRNEPAVAIIEILNENSLTGAWIHGRLAGTKTSGRPANWQDIPPAYARDLTDRYNQWLAATRTAAQRAELRALAQVGAGQPVPRLTAAELPGAPRLRFDTEAAFYGEIESGFFRDLAEFLHHSVGTRALLVGTSDFSYGKSDYPALKARSSLDIIDAHGPWEAAAMVDEPLNSIPVRVSRSAIAGKPFIVSEHNHRFPSDYLCEGIPLLAAYGAFQDWDGVFLYSFELKPRGAQPFVGSRADLSFDPVKLANLAAGALTFRRADVSSARETVLRSYSAEQLDASLRLPVAAAGVYFTPGFSPAVALQHGSRIAGFDGPPTRPEAFAGTSPIVSDTGQLAWYYSPRDSALTGEDDQKFTAAGGSSAEHSGVVTVDSDRTEALIGFLRARKLAVTHFSAEISNPFASLVLCSLDLKPIAHSSHLLLAATARESNTRGGAPTVIEPVTGRVVLRGLAGVAEVGVVPLDGAGRPLGPRTTARKTDEGWELTLGDPATTWYEITLAPGSPSGAAAIGP